VLRTVAILYVIIYKAFSSHCIKMITSIEENLYSAIYQMLIAKKYS